MTLYQMASMLAGQFGMVLTHYDKVERGTILIVRNAPEPGVYIHPKDVPKAFRRAVKN